MLKETILIVNIISFLLFIYGVYNTFIEIEPNVCQMTYMFENPQFKKLHVTNKKFFSNYGLYYYYEGNKKTETKNLNGAPVLFVPGNGGSYRQVRSLASVALRMKVQHKNEKHLDYFTIDYGEELSALYGGYLEKQRYFLQLCMRNITDLYRKSSNKTAKIAIVGHSMGGVVAKSILSEEKYKRHISVIVFLSTPLDRPVVNFDSKMDRFYYNMNRVLHEKRLIKEATNLVGPNEVDNIQTSKEVLLLSIGGGVRDLQVPAWLTKSQYSDIHAMTSAISNVWLSCDHLSIVWCLQLMKVINRFFFSIAVRQSDNYVNYRENFESKYLSAQKYFVGKSLPINPRYQLAVHKIDIEEVWILETSRQFYRTFMGGLEQNHNLLLPLQVTLNNEDIYIQIVSEELNDWLYGCIAEESESEQLACKKVFSLAHHISWIPTARNKKSYALLHTTAIKNDYSDWTHILIKLPASRKTLSLHVDIYNSKERYKQLKTASWSDINEKSIIAKTPQGASFIKLILENITNTYFSIAVNLQKIDCTSEHADITIKITTTWEKGFDEYHVLKAKEQKRRIIVNVPTERIPVKNSTQGIDVDIHLDPTCNLRISQQFSYQHTLRHIIQRSFAYLPGYLTAILLILMAAQASSKNMNDVNLFKKLFSELMQTNSLFIAIACNVFLYFYQAKAGDSTVIDHTYSLFITVMLQGTAIILSILISFSILLLLSLWTSVFTFMTPKLFRISKFFDLLYVPKILTSRLTFGIAIISITFVTCSSLGIALTYLVYFFWISIIYQEEVLGRYERAKVIGEMVSSVETVNELKQPRNFIFHYKLLQLLFVLTMLNFSEILAWAIKYPQLKRSIFTDFQSISTIIVLFSWAILWEIEDLSFLFNNKIVSILFYGSASACVLYVQENVFRLNYVIAFVYISVLFIGLLHKFRKVWKQQSFGA